MDRLRESVRSSDLAGDFWKKMMELRRHRPSPMSFRALAGQILPLVTSLGDQDAADFYEALHHQFLEGAKEGKTPAQGGEKYRLIWNGIPIWHHLQVINYFEENGANFVWEPYTSLTWGNKTRTGRLDRGLIYLIQLCCDAYAFEYAILKERFDRWRLPHLRLEAEATPGSIEQLNVRVQSFVGLAKQPQLRSSMTIAAIRVPAPCRRGRPASYTHDVRGSSLP